MVILLFLQNSAVAQQTDFTQLEGWVRSASTEQPERSRSLTIDSEGNTIITGFFEGSITFSSPAKNVTLTSTLYQSESGSSSKYSPDIFIVKYDLCGNIVWAKTIGAEDDDEGRSITTDAAGNIYLAGHYESKVDFDPGPGTSEKTSSQSTRDIFFAKYDQNGNFVWVKSIGGPDFADILNSITLDQSGNIYLTGSFQRNANFNPNGTSVISSTYNNALKEFTSDVFFAKYSPNGDYIWAKSIGGEYNESGNDIKVSSSGDVYLTGYYAVYADFNPEATSRTDLISAGQEDIFLAKYDASGNYIWAKSFGSNGDKERGNALEIDGNGNLIIAGQFSGTSDFDPGNGTSNLVSKGALDFFIASYNQSGQLNWNKSIGGGSDDVCLGLCIDKDNSIYATGYFSGVADFDPSVNGVSNLNPSGSSQDIFFLKLTSSGQYEWAREIGSDFGVDQGWDIAINKNGNVHITGFYSIGGDFDPTTNKIPILGFGKEDIFLASYSNLGTAKFYNFSVNDDAQCVSNNEFIFEINLPQGESITGLVWKSNGESFGQSNINSQSYAISNEYKISLEVIDNYGCLTTINDTITVGDIPRTSWKVLDNKIEQCLTGNQFSFINETQVKYGQLSYLWNLSNDNTTSTINPVTSYIDDGPYTVILESTSTTGCTSTFSNTITVHPQPNPNFSIGYFSLCENENEITFAAQQKDLTSYSWEFGDNNSSSGTTVKHKYAAGGNYSVTLSVLSDKNCVEKKTESLEILSSPSPTFNVNFSEQPLLTNQFEFVFGNLSENLACTWSLGDGTTVTGTTITHTYSEPGDYTITLETINSSGCSATITKNILVTENPSFSFDINDETQCLNGNTFIFTPSPYPLPSNITYKWLIDKEEFYSGTNATASLTVTEARTFEIEMILLGTGGQTISVTRTITVFPNPEQVSFTINDDKQCLFQNAFAFTASGTLANTYKWDFGDNDGSPASRTTHNYSESGNYTVTLTVISEDLCESSYTQTVIVYENPDAGFTIDNKIQPALTNLFKFEAKKKSSENSYTWELGDNQTREGDLISYSYVSPPKIYEVRLKVKNEFCESESSQFVELVANPEISFIVNREDQCQIGNSFTFTNTSGLGSSAVNYEWFVDGNSFSKEFTPTQPLILSEAKQYIISLVATSINNSANTERTNRIITVNENPVASFNVIGSSSQCESTNAFLIENLSTISSGQLSYYWQYGIETSDQKEPVIRFNKSGIFTIKLTVTTESNCSAIITKTVTVLESPKANFDINSSTQCSNSNTFSFTAIPSSTSSTFFWNLPDGTTSTKTTIDNFNLKDAGTYTVTLTETNSFGCQNSITKEINLLPSPVAEFEVKDNNINQCLQGNLFTFINKSTILNNSTLTYKWKVGNFTSDLQNPPTYPFSDPGTYTITLTATSVTGNCSSSKSLTVTVNPNPNANFDINSATQCSNSNTFSFTAISSSAGSSFLWNLPDGTTSTKTIIDNFILKDAGTYTVTLTETNSFGCQNSITKEINLLPSPVAEFEVKDNNINQCLQGNLFTFINKSTILNNSTLTYKWKVGNFTSDLQNPPTYPFSDPGTYTITLTATSVTGNCSSSKSLTVTVNPNPNANFDINSATQCSNSNTFSFTAISSSAGSSFLWNLPDGTTSTKTTIDNFNLKDARTYTVTLTETNSFGCQNSITKEINLLPSPLADFSIESNKSIQCLDGNSFQFNTATNTLVKEFKWNFGDDEISLEQNPKHSYLKSGQFTVELQVTSFGGCTSLQTKTIIVEDKPSAEFTVPNPTQTFNNNSFQFTPIQTSGFFHFWNFGDGTTTSTIGPSHSYTKTGSYRVLHKITSASGCTSSFEQFVNINTSDQISFAVDKSITCINSNTFKFTNTSKEEAISYEWYANNTLFSQKKEPDLKDFNVGTYTIKLIATFPLKKDTAQQFIIVEDFPNPTFTLKTPSYCLNSNKFTFTPIIQTNQNLLYTWSINNNNTSSQTILNYTFNDATTYDVSLTISTLSGCKSSTTSSVTINQVPVANFNLNKATQCSNSNTFSFTAIPSSTSSTFLWNLPDGTTSTKTTIDNFNLKDARTYTVTLTETNSFGCQNSITKEINLLPSPVAEFEVKDNNINQCLQGNLFTFTNKSTIPNNSTLTYKWKVGNFTSDLQNPPTYPFSDPGTYTITLTATSVTGNCSSSKSLTVTVNPNPNANFDINSATQCSNSNTFSFTAIPSSTSSTFFWNLPDGTTSTKTTIDNFNLKDAGTYTVTLTETNSFGCQNSITKEINLLPSPVAEFEVKDNNINQCLQGNLFTFINKSTILNNSTLTYKWKVGNFTSDLQNPPTYPFSDPGTYTITLTATSVTGNCSSSKSLTVTVIPSINVEIQTSKAEQCLLDNKFEFLGIAPNATGIKWDFKDFTNTIQGFKVSHSFKEAKSYTIKATAYNSACIDSAFYQIRVFSMPEVTFQVNDTEQCEEKNKFEFTGTATVAGESISNYNWTFGDGKTLEGKNQIYSYNTAGLFPVELKATSINGCSSSSTQFVKVIDPPSPEFSINSAEQCIAKNIFEFKNLTNQGSDFIWKMGDGTTFTTRDATHTYSSIDRFTVTLIANYNNGCVDSTLKFVTIKPSQITQFTITSEKIQCENNNLITTKNNSTDAFGNLLYSWVFGDGTVKREIEPVHRYSKDGNYRITLLSTNIFGCLDSTFENVTIKDLPDRTISINDSIQCLLNNNFIISAGNKPDPDASYSWLLEPDKFSNNFTITHTVTAYDTLLIKLTVSKNGCEDSAFNKIYIPENPKPAFQINDTIQCLSQNQFILTNLSTSTLNPLEYAWSLNNKFFSKEISTIISSTVSGKNKISLIATNKEGCSDSTFIETELITNPILKFEINDSTQCITENNYIFTNKSTSKLELKNFIWKIDEIKVNESVNFSYESKNVGKNKIKLIAIDTEGCTDSLTRIISTGEQPLGQNITFVSAVINKPLKLAARNFINTTYAWTPKVGLNNYSIQNPTYQYDQETLYFILMENEFNCTYTDSLQVLIFKEKDIMMPKAFTPNGDGINDVIKPFLIGIQEFKFIRIFNRWGNLVYESKDPNQGWNGIYKGTKQSMETYTWITEGIDIDGQVIKRGGNFILLR